MDRSLKTWEMALLFGLLCAVAAGTWLGHEQQELSDQVVRMHVIANSDSPQDQALKLAVRDRVLERAEQFYTRQTDRDQALEQLVAHLPELAQEGQNVVEEWGMDLEVTAQVERCWFPTKEYENFALPAGEYTSLRIVLGEGQGQNWWCVAFPPLCLGAASVSVDEAVQAGEFTQDQARLMTGESQRYALKFKSMELLGQLKGLFQ